jgi:N-formylglutamate deformylase
MHEPRLAHRHTRRRAADRVSCRIPALDLPGSNPPVVSPWLARADADWWIDRLYDFAATRRDRRPHRDLAHGDRRQPRSVRRLALSGSDDDRAVPDRDLRRRAALPPDGLPDAEIERRRATYFEPYHAALAAEIARLRAMHRRVVLYDCHSIRSVLPRLFEGTLPDFNLGTNDGPSCDPELAGRSPGSCAATGESSRRQRPLQGRLHHPPIWPATDGVHALQMELGLPRLYARARGTGAPDNWPRLRPGIRRADPRDADRNPEDLPSTGPKPEPEEISMTMPIPASTMPASSARRTAPSSPPRAG